MTRTPAGLEEDEAPLAHVAVLVIGAGRVEHVHGAALALGVEDEHGDRVDDGECVESVNGAAQKDVADGDAQIAQHAAVFLRRDRQRLALQDRLAHAASGRDGDEEDEEEGADAQVSDDGRVGVVHAVPVNRHKALRAPETRAVVREERQRGDAEVDNPVGDGDEDDADDKVLRAHRLRRRLRNRRAAAGKRVRVQVAGRAVLVAQHLTVETQRVKAGRAARSVTKK